MRRGGRGRSHPRLVSALDWSNKTRGSMGNRDVSSDNSRRGRARGQALLQTEQRLRGLWQQEGARRLELGQRLARKACS